MNNDELIDQWRSALIKKRQRVGEYDYILAIRNMMSQNQADYSLDLGTIQAIAIEVLGDTESNSFLLLALVQIITRNWVVSLVAVEAAWIVLEDLIVKDPRTAMSWFGQDGIKGNQNFKWLSLLESIDSVIGKQLTSDQQFAYSEFRNNLRNNKKLIL